MSTPERITHREVREILRTFHDSGWAAMTLEMDGMRITVGKDGLPAAPTPTAPTTSAPTASAATVPSTPPAAPAAPTTPVPAEVQATAGNGGAAPVAAAPVPAAAADTTGCTEVKSPTVGAFWTAPSPGEAPFVTVGQTIEAGQQLAIVEVMKLMNPVVAPQGGEIVQICANNAELVGFDQPLFLIRPTDG
ncbi:MULTISPECIES: acetyl-CoA carboxylase biotin carboxyl carrier protein [Rhodococcus]|uniref:Biotin carboxyl carrier protein of acetyl-CoA carboxylase n=1 Tax=Rhodococcus opacus RKJ300 = JCM 13270 TaxID=1165867 RepID=I0WNU2_RHOOP|nr:MULTISPECIES: biotin/lipoyl-containing protein [Rhodococcus]EID78058.1 acetyl-CoA carboxylase biotin carboxyl carrier protein [Rhodococcus opacus RKJ300 = JCM 13270]QQZ19569.1 acetyl-CoA carboxylase biotin carboxyl carrier protein subunit [Rhodococcus sp. 21391]